MEHTLERLGVDGAPAGRNSVIFTLRPHDMCIADRREAFEALKADAVEQGFAKGWSRSPLVKWTVEELAAAPRTRFAWLFLVSDGRLRGYALLESASLVLGVTDAEEADKWSEWQTDEHGKRFRTRTIPMTPVHRCHYVRLLHAHPTGRGHGRALVEAIHAGADAQYVMTKPELPARRFWLRMGYASEVDGRRVVSGRQPDGWGRIEGVLARRP